MLVLASLTELLLECTGEQLGNVVLHAYPNFTSKDLKDALTVLKSIAVIPVALGVLQSDFGLYETES